jgi:hypothetical protein
MYISYEICKARFETLCTYRQIPAPSEQPTFLLTIQWTPTWNERSIFCSRLLQIRTLYPQVTIVMHGYVFNYAT